eukprot:GHVQ01014392.1.p1 GENE.GHVQ01014392.1~~GHVQ01014392.1.p1  ORF type:complete len:137 (+),score=20.01 GHVQ01014392.1:714-1124(+)
MQGEAAGESEGREGMTADDMQPNEPERNLPAMRIISWTQLSQIGNELEEEAEVSEPTSPGEGEESREGTDVPEEVSDAEDALHSGTQPTTVMPECNSGLPWSTMHRCMVPQPSRPVTRLWRTCAKRKHPCIMLKKK